MSFDTKWLIVYGALFIGSLAVGALAGPGWLMSFAIYCMIAMLVLLFVVCVVRFVRFEMWVKLTPEENEEWKRGLEEDDN